MPKSIISEGKTTKEAVDAGLAQLKVSKDMVEIKVIENEDKRSFFSILAPRVVKVELTVKENAKQENKKVQKAIKQEERIREYTNPSEENLKLAKDNIEKFLIEWSKIIDGDMKYEVLIENYYILINITGSNLNHLIGYRGEVLNSVQVLFSSIANKDISEKIRVLVDIENYREKREKTLEDLAEKIAKTVIRNRKSITLEPMSSFERKIIHTKLQDNNKVKTESVGEEPYRKIIISLK